MIDCSKTPVVSAIDVTALVSIHYFEFSKNYHFSGEAHPFWEAIYADKGQIEAVAGQNGYLVRQGEILFVKPNQFHSLWANGHVAPNMIVLSFECVSPHMNLLEDKTYTLDDMSRSLLGQIIEEAHLAFSSPLDEPFLHHLEIAENCPFAALQMMRLLLEHLLILLARRGEVVKTGAQASSSIKERSDNIMIQQVQAYLLKNINRPLTFDEIRRQTFMGGTKLKTIFKRQTGRSVIEYFGHLKTEAAKNALRETGMNITQVSQSLGYSSIHYFSRQFKKHTGLTPRQYTLSVEAKRFQKISRAP